ncbi:MAG: UDP-N-acetylmuramate--L-alanine ligase [Oligoflexia bacterium]|nr:UDP-N-acetylmuramate--L-alanine ligase [Oligoflexia bacterium]
MRKIQETQLHFIGIGGIGMSGIAEVFLNQGFRVSGSDLSESDLTRRLASLGARISIGHQAQNVRGAHVVIISSAVRPDNAELVEAKKLHIPVIPRAEMLGELMRGKTGIAVAGTHGKTTTTSMVATILTECGLDPTLVIGGKVDSFGGNAKLGQGKYVVAEADESDGSFLHLPATYGVVTNIDGDHLDHFGSLEKIEDAFVDFVAKLPFYGLAAVCIDDPGVKRCLPRFTKPVMTYGVSPEADIYASDIVTGDSGAATRFVVHRRRAPFVPNQPHERLGQVDLHVPGRHNVLNALAAITIALELGLGFAVIAHALSQFRGVKRRFDICWRDDAAKRIVVDDYGHHPTEIRATLAAARGYWKGRIITIFQPHRYSRTLHCKDEFLSAFTDTDVLWMTDIYSAGEDPIPGVTAEALVASIRAQAGAPSEVTYVKDLAAAKASALEKFSDGDMILCLGAGSITKLAEQLATELGKK